MSPRTEASAAHEARSDHGHRVGRRKRRQSSDKAVETITVPIMAARRLGGDIGCSATMFCAVLLLPLLLMVVALTLLAVSGSGARRAAQAFAGITSTLNGLCDEGVEGDRNRSVTCRQTLERLSLSMKADADPCDDFYEHVCGNWTPRRRHAVAEKRSRAALPRLEPQLARNQRPELTGQRRSFNPQTSSRLTGCLCPPESIKVEYAENEALVGLEVVTMSKDALCVDEEGASSPNGPSKKLETFFEPRKNASISSNVGMSSSTPDWQKVYEKRVNLQGTKKGCAATMNLKWIELYPDFQVDVPQPCGQTREGRLIADNAKELQEALDAEQHTVAKETRVYVRIANCSSHQSHGFEYTEAFSQSMDKNVAEQIQMLARECITSVSDVKKCLHYYVHDVLFANKEKPDSSCRTFFPTHRDISNQIQAVLKKDRFSTVDQENAIILMEKIGGEQPESSVVYRPYAARSFVGSSNSDNVEKGVASECEDTSLFCFQTKFMRSMLKKYGGSLVCLDATHKTSDYALPLFFLVVKTPSGYTPAGVFIIQFETAHCIAEALDVFKQWCDNWSPQY
ncbi:hypothetical protein HPB51_023760 [Rhipicephalus microplus]|uniref:ZSWIM1/3 RNaseH-like domain-containing protein n=1 Tax=Rhipicephalus microplus TaxID=6941 RepID=A0A9J6E3U5_RHIMP|nr:hypothetical protein HPB51_023760 [Rhipicephalus microplus]